MIDIILFNDKHKLVRIHALVHNFFKKNRQMKHFAIESKSSELTIIEPDLQKEVRLDVYQDIVQIIYLNKAQLSELINVLNICYDKM